MRSREDLFWVHSLETAGSDRHKCGAGRPWHDVCFFGSLCLAIAIDVARARKSDRVARRGQASPRMDENKRAPKNDPSAADSSSDEPFPPLYKPSFAEWRGFDLGPKGTAIGVGGRTPEQAKQDEEEQKRLRAWVNPEDEKRLDEFVEWATERPKSATAASPALPCDPALKASLRAREKTPVVPKRVAEPDVSVLTELEFSSPAKPTAARPPSAPTRAGAPRVHDRAERTFGKRAPSPSSTSPLASQTPSSGAPVVVDASSGVGLDAPDEDAPAPEVSLDPRRERRRSNVPLAVAAAIVLLLGTLVVAWATRQPPRARIALQAARFAQVSSSGTAAPETSSAPSLPKSETAVATSTTPAPRAEESARPSKTQTPTPATSASTRLKDTDPKRKSSPNEGMGDLLLPEPQL